MGLALSPFLLARLGWRGLFVIFGAVGFPLLALWLAVVPKPAGVPQLPQLSPQPGQEQFRRQLNAEPEPRDEPLPKQAAPLPADPSHALPKQRLPTPGLDATSLVGAVQPPDCSRQGHSPLPGIAASSHVFIQAFMQACIQAKHHTQRSHETIPALDKSLLPCCSRRVRGALPHLCNLYSVLQQSSDGCCRHVCCSKKMHIST